MRFKRDSAVRVARSWLMCLQWNISPQSPSPRLDCFSINISKVIFWLVLCLVKCSIWSTLARPQSGLMSRRLETGDVTNQNNDWSEFKSDPRTGLSHTRDQANANFPSLPLTGGDGLRWEGKTYVRCYHAGEQTPRVYIHINYLWKYCMAIALMLTFSCM